MSKATMQRGVLGLVFWGAAAGGAGAQVIVTPPRPEPPGRTATGFCNGGPFTLSAGQVRVHVALDDFVGGREVRVFVRLYDRDGNVVAGSGWQGVAPGKTVTLDHAHPGPDEMLLRPHVTFETAFSASPRRAVVSSVQVHDTIDGFTAVIPVICSPPADPVRPV